MYYGSNRGKKKEKNGKIANGKGDILRREK